MFRKTKRRIVLAIVISLLTLMAVTLATIWLSNRAAMRREYEEMLRAYTDVAQEVRDFTYNVYWGPEEGGDEQLEMIVNAIQQNSITQNNTENRRYNVTALWNGRETDLSNTIYLGPSVSVEETAPEATSLQVFPNPVRQLLTIQGQGLQRITLHTLTGVLVEDRPAEGDHLTLSMESLPKGMYLVGIRSDEGYRVVKVVKE